MPPTIIYSDQAGNDLDEITDYFLANLDEDTAIKAITTILTEIAHLAETPMLGTRIADLGIQYRVWPIYKSRFKIYFERFSEDQIKVFRVYGSKRPPLKAEEVFNEK